MRRARGRCALRRPTPRPRRCGMRRSSDMSRTGDASGSCSSSSTAPRALRLAEGPDAAGELFERAARAVRSGVRRSDVLAHEDDGRIWLIAPDAVRAGAAALAARVADAVEGAASSRGAPLTASIGLALYPDDGRSGEELMAQAEEGAYAARAAGVRVVDGPDEPAASGPRLVP